MDKIERLGWAPEVCISVLGVPIRVRATLEPALIQAINQLPGTRIATAPSFPVRRYSIIVGPSPPRGNQRSFHFLFRETHGLARSPYLDHLWEPLETDIARYVAQTAKHWLFVHAGVVGWKGRAIILPGRSLSGKTTLVKELIQSGASYYSDEFAVLDEHGLVHPFPKPLSIRSADRSDRTRVKAESLGAAVGSRPLPVALIVATHYEDQGRWRPKVISPGEGALVLLANTLQARTRPCRAIDILRKVVSGAEVIRSARSTAEEVAAAILRR